MRRVLTFLLFMNLSFSVSGQRFPCNGQIFVSSHNASSTSILRDNYIPFSSPFLSPTTIYQGALLDAIGFNPEDYYMYAVQENTNAIVRLKKDNNFDTIGIFDDLDMLDSKAGECTPEGFYICHEASLNSLLVFDVVEDFKFMREIKLFWDPQSENQGTFTTRIFDLVIDPYNPSIAYTFQGNYDDPELAPSATKGFLLEINVDLNDPNVGMVTPVIKLESDDFIHLGGLLFSAGNGLMGYGSLRSEINPKQSNLYTINQLTGETALFIKHFNSDVSDGCSCSSAFSFANFVPKEGMFCNGERKTFVININNNSSTSINDVILRDTLPEGMILREVNGLNQPAITISGIGTQILEIEGLNIGAREEIKINLRVESIDAKVGRTTNQVFLHNMPARFDGPMGSDELGTVNLIGDPSVFYVIPRILEDAEWEINEPTDCLLANDAELTFTSPQLFPDQEYEIKMRNKVDWKEYSFQVRVDRTNSFVIDSLSTGIYQMYQLRSLQDNCSMKVDVDIEIEAPHHLLSLEAKSNSPICEGEDIELSGTLSPEGETRWTGPNRFGSDYLNSIIESAPSENNGNYKIKAEYGYCEQHDTLTVAVEPIINASIVGDPEYCERDRMELSVSATGKKLTHKWKGPNTYSSEDNLIITSIRHEDKGVYSVISDNGACQDSAELMINVLPTPTISLDKIFQTDFCSSVTIEPELLGDSDVTYRWSPDQGLDCYDCPAPMLEPIVQSHYNLHVENEYACTDSATVKIELDKNNLAYTPNIFIKELSGENSRFTLFPGCIVRQVHDLKIYDRWGSLVFQDKPTALNSIGQWEGYIKNQLVNSGIYSWIAEIELVDGSLELLYGNITVLTGP